MESAARATSFGWRSVPATPEGGAVDIASRFPGSGEWASLRRHLLALSIVADVVLDLHSDMEATMFMYTNGRR